MRPWSWASRSFHASTRHLSHENPLGLPRSGTPPSWPRRPVKRTIPGVKHVIAVSSAKGGVGKSTIAANLSLAFAKLGHRSGILDTDIFGPSIPTLFNLSGEPRLSSDNRLVPLVNYGVKTMSMGYLAGEEAVVWRGPMVMKAIQQLLHDVKWDDLDILVLDLPPGTGDTQLTITQQVILDGSVIVSTPHTLAMRDAVRGISMFETVGVKMLGLIENMSLYKCPHCHHESNVFGSTEKVKDVARDHGIDFISEIPLNPRIGSDAMDEKPIVAADPAGEIASLFVSLASLLGNRIGL